MKWNDASFILLQLFFSSSLSPFIIFWQHWDGSYRTSCCKCGCFSERFLCFRSSVTQFIPCKIRHVLSARFLLDFNIYSLWHSDPFAEGMCKDKAQCRVIPSFHHSFSSPVCMGVPVSSFFIFNSVTLLHFDVSQPRPYSMHVSAVAITVCDIARAVCEKDSRFSQIIRFKLLLIVYKESVLSTFFFP